MGPGRSRWWWRIEGILLTMVVEQIRRQYGCRDVYTTVDDENTRAVKLYRSFGFQPTEEMDEAERVYVLRGEEG